MSAWYTVHVYEYVYSGIVSVSTIVYACDTIKVLTTKIDATSHNM